MSVTTIGAIAASRRPKWQYPPPPPTPRILHLPRRSRRRSLPKLKKPLPPPPKTARGSESPASEMEAPIGKLEALFGQERAFAKESVPIVMIRERRRGRVSSESVSGGALEEEKWKFQAEMLRAECNLMRMEKEIAVKKMERARVKSQRALRFVVHSLVSERKKISEGNNSKVELEEEIQELAEKMERLRRNLEEKNLGARRKCHNFDEQAADIQRELKMFRGSSDEVCVKKIQEMAEVSLSVNTMCSKANNNETSVSSDDSNVEILRRKMEGLSNGTLLERMKEECGSMLSTANSSVASSASTSKRIELADSPSPLQQQVQESMWRDTNMCSGRCKVVVRRILEQVKAETEQWSQMQEMLGQVREEMEELQASRDFWEDRALDYDYKIQSLQSDVQEWKRKAISSESKATKTESQVYMLVKELEKQSRKEEKSPPVMMDGQNEMEKRVLIFRLKENQNNYQYLHHHRHQGQAVGQIQNQSQSNISTSSNGNKQKEGISSNGGRRKTHSRRTVVASERPVLKDIGNSCVSFKQENKPTSFPLVPSRTSKNV